MSQSSGEPALAENQGSNGPDGPGEARTGVTSTARRPYNSTGIVQRSVRMSRGARELLAMAIRILNENKKPNEPQWALGEAAEQAIQDEYHHWRRVRDHLTPDDIKKAAPRRGRKPKPVSQVDKTRPADKQGAASPGRDKD